MSKRNTIVVILIGLLLFTSNVFARKDDDDDDEQALARDLSKRGVILPLTTVVEKAQQLHQGKILEVELKRKSKRYRYEIEILDENGVVWEMEFDAVSADLIKLEKED